MAGPSIAISCSSARPPLQILIAAAVLIQIVARPTSVILASFCQTYGLQSYRWTTELDMLKPWSIILFFAWLGEFWSTGPTLRDQRATRPTSTAGPSGPSPT
jgi:hypothetical protein